MADDPDAEILIETTRIGNAVEVRAVSGGDGLEISFTAPASAGQADVNRLARAKLSYVRGKSRAGGQAGGGQTGGGESGRGGLLA